MTRLHPADFDAPEEIQALDECSLAAKARTVAFCAVAAVLTFAAGVVAAVVG